MVGLHIAATYDSHWRRSPGTTARRDVGALRGHPRVRHCVRLRYPVCVVRGRCSISTPRYCHHCCQVTPIHPFKLELRVSEMDAIYEAVNVFYSAALGPGCGTVMLVLYWQKGAREVVHAVIDPKTLQQIWHFPSRWDALDPQAEILFESVSGLREGLPVSCVRSQARDRARLGPSCRPSLRREGPTSDIWSSRRRARTRLWPP